MLLCHTSVSAVYWLVSQCCLSTVFGCGQLFCLFRLRLPDFTLLITTDKTGTSFNQDKLLISGTRKKKTDGLLRLRFCVCVWGGYMGKSRYHQISSQSHRVTGSVLSEIVSSQLQ